MKRIIFLLVFIWVCGIVGGSEQVIYDYADILSESDEDWFKDDIGLYSEETKSRMKVLTLIEEDYLERYDSQDELVDDYLAKLGFLEGSDFSYNADLLIIIIQDEAGKRQLIYGVLDNSVFEPTNLKDAVFDETIIKFLKGKEENTGQALSYLINHLIIVAHSDISSTYDICLFEIIGGTTVPEVIYYGGKDKKEDLEKESKNQIQEPLFVYYDYETWASKACEELLDDDVIEVKLTPETEYGFFGNLISRKPMKYEVIHKYDSDFENDYSTKVKNGKRYFGRGRININIYPESLEQNKEYTLTITAYGADTLLKKKFRLEYNPGKSECKTFKKGTDEKFKIYFMGEQYLNLESFKKDIGTALDYDSEGFGLFSVEPFKSNKNRFTFYYNSYPLGKSYKSLTNECPHDASIVFSHEDFGSYVNHLSNIMHFSKEEYSIDAFQKTFVHEFGHLFGQLKDEYDHWQLGAFDFVGSPNCAFDLETAKDWWEELEGVGSNELKVGFFDGCVYSKNNVRPVENSVMNFHHGVSENRWIHAYGPVNERCLLKIIKEGGKCKKSDLSTLKRYNNQIKEAYS